MKVRIFLAFVPFLCAYYLEMNQVFSVNSQELHNPLDLDFTNVFLNC